jgi:opacity protein-like surface antigen
MKKVLPAFVTLFLVSSLSHAQIYVKAYSGYSVSANPEKRQSTEIVDGIKNVYQEKYKWGEGINAGFALGYRFNKNFSFEITSGTQLLNKKKFLIPQKDVSASNNWQLSGNFGETKYKSSIFQLSPQLAYTVDYNKNMLFYLKTGPEFLTARNYYHRSYTGFSFDSFRISPNQTELAVVRKGPFKMGLRSSAGVEYKLSKNLHFTGEFISVLCNYEFETIETTNYTVDGIDRLNDFGWGPQENTRGIKTDFSSWGFNIGIIYFFKKR